MMTTTRFRQTGFSLIEALTALLVTAFGMLAIAGFQVSLSQSSDIAKQRSEAVRLAQLKIEELRAFEQVASDGVGNKFDFTSDLVSGTDTVSPTSGSYTTNTTYARAWTVTGVGTDPQKWVRVAVSWTDRTNTTQTVNLQTVIARADPVSIGTLAVGPGGTRTRSPKNRNVEIPYPAISLAGDKSGFQPPGSSQFFIFDNLSGEVLGYCTSPLSEGATVDFTNGICFEYVPKPYLLTGYIRFVLSNSPSASDLINPTDTTKELTVSVVPDSGLGTMAGCYTQRQKVVSAGNISAPRNIQSATRNSTGTTVTVVTQGNHGLSATQYVSINGATNIGFNGVFQITSVPSNTSFTYAQVGPANQSFSGGTPPSTATQVQEITIPETDTAPTGYNALKSTFVAYTCLVTPVNHDSDADTPNRWTGTVQITPAGSPSWAIGTASTQFKVCRYTGNYVVDNVISNSEHPSKYWGVTGPLDNQNFVVIKGNQNCPTDTAANPATSKYTNMNTREHQPTLTQSAGGGFTGTESGSLVNGALPMF